MTRENQPETVAHRLGQSAHLYREGQASEVMTKTLNKLFGMEADTCKRQLNTLREDLLEFEQKYKISSEDFYNLFPNGQTDDRMDYVEWASLCQTVRRLENRLSHEQKITF